MANDYTTSLSAFGDISEGNYIPGNFPEMETFITAASRLIDSEVGRWEGFFYPSTDTVTRYYDGSGYDEQMIDEFASITSVAVSEQGGTASTDYTTWSSSDYFAYPYNAALDGKPITKLVVDFNGSKAAWYGYRKAVQVVGLAGYSVAVNSIVASACRRQAVIWFMKAKGGYQEQSGGDTAAKLAYTDTSALAPEVKSMLHGLKLELER